MTILSKTEVFDHLQVFAEKKKSFLVEFAEGGLRKRKKVTEWALPIIDLKGVEEGPVEIVGRYVREDRRVQGRHL
jgi:hypothetical protein